MLRRVSKLKPMHTLLMYRPSLLITCVVLSLIAVFIFFLHNTGQDAISSNLIPMKSSSIFDTSPTVEMRNGTELISQIPDSPKAVLFLAHGCNGRAINFWDPSPSCPNCIGLPEERFLLLNALARKFAVITISSSGRCWTFGKELITVRDTIKYWVAKSKLENLPLVAMGASSGGYFVSTLATTLRFSSITLMIAEGLFDQMDIDKNYPPTLFVHMPKDLHRQRKIIENADVLRNKGIDVAVIECKQFPLSPYLLAERIPRLDRTTSALLFELLQKKGFIDEYGYMKKDGRTTPWRDLLGQNKDLSLDTSLLRHIEEELNLAFAYHEMTSLQSEHIFEWFESHMSYGRIK